MVLGGLRGWPWLGCRDSLSISVTENGTINPSSPFHKRLWHFYNEKSLTQLSSFKLMTLLAGSRFFSPGCCSLGRTFFQTEVSKVWFGQSSCSSTPAMSTLVFPALTWCSPHSHTAACKNHPGTRAHLQPCLCFTQHGHTLFWGLDSVCGHFLSTVRNTLGSVGCCVCQTPRGHSCCNLGSLECSNVQSCLCHPSKGDFVISVMGQEEGAEIQRHRQMSLVVNAAISLGF